MVNVTIITPLYKGKKYLTHLYKMISDCAQNAQQKARVEWVISNDYPSETIELEDTTGLLDITVLNTEINCGIQGARVRGLEAATGEYVLFLDQDDWIAPNWVESQLNHIGNADACVCSATRDWKKFYGTFDRPELEVCASKEYNISTNWGFIPGQVLIKKEVIPELWKKKWLKWNCCDDYLLWLLMFAQGSVFAVNNEVLYDHVSTGSNQSLNTFEWYKSTQEVIELLKEEKVLKEDELKSFINARQEMLDESFRDKTWCNSKLDILNNMLKLYEQNKSISEVIYSQYGAEARIAIYGTTIGMHVYEKLKHEGMDVGCFIDQKAKELDLPIPAYAKENLPNTVDIVINTLVRDDSEVKKYIEEQYPGTRVIHIKELMAFALRGVS